MATYQGHKNWNHWNVSLWIGNDESLYRMALRCKRGRTLGEAAKVFLQELQDMGISKTPDGAPYGVTTIRAAMSGLE